MRGKWQMSLFGALLLAGMLLALALPAGATRIKDIARFGGVRENQIYGIGLVAGLQGTGDNVRNSPYAAELVVGMLKNLGFDVDPQQLRRLDNFAVVMVTATLPPFAKPGDTIDVTVSAIGSATSLEGGVLLQTALKGADGKVYAVAQGPVSLGSTIGGGGAGRRNRHLTTGRVPEGAIVERAVPVTLIRPDPDRIFPEEPVLRLNLSHPDLTTATQVAGAINQHFGEELAKPLDGSTIAILVPPDRRARLIEFMSEVEGLTVKADQRAKVVINQRTGTVVVGGDVEVLPVAIAQSGISLVITGQSPGQEEQEGGEEAALTASQAEGQVVSRSLAQVSTADVVAALNALGATPEQIVAIFEALAASGALLAELEII